MHRLAVKVLKRSFIDITVPMQIILILINKKKKLINLLSQRSSKSSFSSPRKQFDNQESNRCSTGGSHDYQHALAFSWFLVWIEIVLLICNLQRLPNISLIVGQSSVKITCALCSWFIHHNWPPTTYILSNTLKGRSQLLVYIPCWSSISVLAIYGCMVWNIIFLFKSRYTYQTPLKCRKKRKEIMQ